MLNGSNEWVYAKVGWGDVKRSQWTEKVDRCGGKSDLLLGFSKGRFFERFSIFLLSTRKRNLARMVVKILPANGKNDGGRIPVGHEKDKDTGLPTRPVVNRQRLLSRRLSWGHFPVGRMARQGLL